MTTPEQPEKKPAEPTGNQPEPGFGWTNYAEQLNGRFAMLGLAALILIEVFSHQGFLEWLGLR